MLKLFSSIIVPTILVYTPLIASDYEIATFAGGCFWCMEQPFDSIEGVINVIPGYTGGATENPTYREVSTGTTGHYEAVQITFDSSKVTFEDLLDLFWTQVNPTDNGGQFADRGQQYKTAIFFHSKEQKYSAEKSKEYLGKTGVYSSEIITEVIQFQKFYPAEDYHNDYYKKNPKHYRMYKEGSGRLAYIKKMKAIRKNSSKDKSYNKPSIEEIKKRLTPLQFNVTQRKGTERAFENSYWNNKREGIYVDIITGEPLFSSKDKYKSGTGWPSFFRPIKEGAVNYVDDSGFFMKRIEVVSRHGKSHLGHVFDDGPKPTGKRYCVNSASLIFIPVEDLKKRVMKSMSLFLRIQNNRGFVTDLIKLRL